jgi:hypothetical protein
MLKLDKKTVAADLKRSVAEVIFRKEDGTFRTMKATLSTQYLPVREEYIPGQNEEIYPVNNENVLAVWDIEANGWRSFRLDSVISIQKLDSY